MNGISVLRRVPRSVSMTLAILLVGMTMAVAVGTSSAVTPQRGQVSVRVADNQLVDGTGNAIRLLGMDRSGTEFACSQGYGIFDGPSDASSVATMASWHINAVRVPLNEDCWLGINGVKPAYGGANYQSAIQGYVQTLHAAGLVAILDLHWNAPGGQLARGQQLMADADHSPAFWASVASSFKSDPGVVFDLYNEPHDISWSCWRDGCNSPGYQTAGMQSLVNAVRATGATQPVMVGGLGWAGDLSEWLAFQPSDPGNALVASLHLYNFSGCTSSSCWDQTIAPVAARVPVVTGELGESDCAHSFIDGYMGWADRHGVSYLGWTWNAGGGWSCGGGPSLITSYDGTPTAFGEGLRSHLATVSPIAAPPTTAPPTTAPPTTAPPTTAPPTTAPPAGSVTVAYRVVNTWQQGLQASIDITNHGLAPLGTASAPWTLQLNLPASASVDLWNATSFSPAPGVFTAVGPSWHSSIAPGQTWSVGYVVQGGHDAPTGCMIDGKPCTFVHK